MKQQITWVPLSVYGDTFYQCTVELAGHVVSSTSRSKPKALSYALEELAKIVMESGQPNP